MATIGFNARSASFARAVARFVGRSWPLPVAVYFSFNLHDMIVLISTRFTSYSMGQTQNLKAFLTVSPFVMAALSIMPTLAAAWLIKFAYSNLRKYAQNELSCQRCGLLQHPLSTPYVGHLRKLTGISIVLLMLSIIVSIDSRGTIITKMRIGQTAHHLITKATFARVAQEPGRLYPAIDAMVSHIEQNRRSLADGVRRPGHAGWRDLAFYAVVPIGWAGGDVAWSDVSNLGRWGLFDGVVLQIAMRYMGDGKLRLLFEAAYYNNDYLRESIYYLLPDQADLESVFYIRGSFGDLMQDTDALRDQCYEYCEQVGVELQEQVDSLRLSLAGQVAELGQDGATIFSESDRGIEAIVTSIMATHRETTSAPLLSSVRIRTADVLIVCTVLGLLLLTAAAVALDGPRVKPDGIADLMPWIYLDARGLFRVAGEVHAVSLAMSPLFVALLWTFQSYPDAFVYHDLHQFVHAPSRTLGTPATARRSCLERIGRERDRVARTPTAGA